ncbi:hypothetical protein [Xanthomonas sp. 3307]|uniref:hypothetical protein n=1 Tax=Xanthomonas sp. 3307 TaxID=3035316 RepID=UPI0017C2937D|nr:hypothetical protein [Xanthomonas sp. 3307]MBB5942019.1 hypothetical protein [Xanthomonas sp. 3307]
MPHPITLSSAFGLTLLLAACGGQPQPASDAAPKAAATEAAPAPATPDSARKGKDGMIKECPGARLHLTPLPSADASAPAKTQVALERNGQQQPLAPPPEMADYTPVGLGCSENAKGDAYFVVQYGELPYGCEFCEWFFLYDGKGQLLNHANPPLREEQGQQSPNNDEYEHQLEALGLKHPDVEPFLP